MSLAYRFLVTAEMGGQSLGSFQTFAGGEKTADSVKDRPPGVEGQKSLGGPSSITNVTVTRTFDADVDTSDLRSRSRKAAGHAPGSVSIQPLDADMNPKGKADVFTGRLVRYKGPEANSNSNDKATVEYEFEIDG